MKSVQGLIELEKEQWDLHENSIFPQRNPQDGMWKKSEQAPPNGVSMGDCKSNLIVFIRTPHKFGFVLKSFAKINVPTKPSLN